MPAGVEGGLAASDTMTKEPGPSGLYATLMGASWLEVAEPIRVAHTSGSTIRARGRLRIGHGRSRAARLVARVLGLPRASDAARTQLTIVPDAGGEAWRRTFDDRQLDTRQYAVGDGVLAERFGVLEFRFRLEESEGGLLFRHLGTAVTCGPVRMPLLSAWSPRIDAREDAIGPRQILVHVCILLPVVGPVLTYEGTMELEDVPT